MKIRQDFVTNSSSSSFIIGKYDDESVTKNAVFNLLKSYYKEFLAKRDKLIKDMDKFGLGYKQENGGWGVFYFKDGVSIYDKSKRALLHKIEKEYGVDLFVAYNKTYDWLNCKTYGEYEKFWINMLKTTGRNAPFSIHDYTINRKFCRVEGGTWALENLDDNSAKDCGLISWYIPCIDDEHLEEFNGIRNCNTCRDEYCYLRNRKDRDSIIATVNKSKITDKNAVALLLGKVCIHSECGYIPDEIVEKLSKISRFYCNHMG